MKIAVIGLGFMGSTHLKALRNIPNAQLAAVADGDERRLSGDLSGIQGNIGGPGEVMDFGGAAKYKAWQEAIDDPDVEAVDVCLPTNLHAPVALAALRAGRHVLVEKPMASSGTDADAMVAEAEKQKRVLMTAQVLRFWPEYVVAGRMVKSGELGAVRSALFRRRCAAPGWGGWMKDPAQSGGGVFDLLIHDVDCALNLFGAPASVSASGYEAMEQGIDFILGRFHYPGGPVVAITGGWHHPGAYPFSMEFTIVADGGTLEFSSAGRPLTLYTAEGTEKRLDLPMQDGYQAEIAYFLACAASGRPPVECLAADSARAVKLALAMVESRTHNGEPIACKL